MRGPSPLLGLSGFGIALAFKRRQDAERTPTSLSTLDRCAALGLTAALSSTAAYAWPAIQPLNISFEADDGSSPAVRAVILEENGDPLYVFSCRAGEDGAARSASDAGELDCRLVAARPGPRTEDLLVESHGLPPAVAYRRGRVLPRELLGDCAEYPEYGRVRHFRLREMAITMAFEDVHVGARASDGAPALLAYKLNLSVDRDPAAIRDIAESPGYVAPAKAGAHASGSCQIVRRASEWADY